MNRGIRGTILSIFSLALFIPCICNASDNDLEKDLQKELQRSKTLIEQICKKLNTGDPITNELKQLKALAEEIKASDLLIQEKFSKREEELKTKGLTAQGRQRIMEEGYSKALREYLGLIAGLPPEGSIQQSTVEDIKTLLEKILPKKTGHIFGSLPYQHLNYPSRAPDQSSSIKPAYKGGNKTVSPDDLKDTEEAPLSLEIATLAESLNWKPVAIYEYVKNNIETEWYWGCMKGAEETLRQKSGNDCDQATLFAALLRASGFPTRYVRGTMEFFASDGKPINKVKNLTGIDEPMKIAEFFQKAGIPYTPIMQGGKITNFQIEHIWIESRIPYGNYRGTMIDDSDPTWLGLDTSIKTKNYAYNDPLDILTKVPLGGLGDIYLNSVSTLTPLEYVKGSIEGYLAQSSPGVTYKDFLRTKTLMPQIMNILPNTMQFEQRRITNEYTEVPEELKHKVKLSAFSGQPTTTNNQLFEITLDTMKLSNKAIMISYEPETVEDQETIDSYGGLDNTPAYLVRLRPILKVDGEMVVAGQDGLPMGEEHTLTVELISPNGTEKVTNTQITGNVVAIGIVAQKAISDEQTAISEDAAGRILQKEAISYIDRWNKAEDELAALLHLAISRPIPAVVTVGGVIDVTYLMDIPHGFQWKGTFVDASLRAINTVVANSGSPSQDERRKTFMVLSGLQGSILENRIFEDDFQVDAISTAKLFEIAKTNQIPILTIDSSNIASVFPTLSFGTNIKEDIANSINQDLKVRIPQSEITYKDWTGIGYVKENPDTGEAGYMLSGMIAGGMTAVSPEKWLSQGLRNVMQRPYSGNTVISPVMINIIFPYDGATLGASQIDVEGLVSDTIAKVDVNGIKAEVSREGRFIARGVSLATGANQITATATSLLGKSASQSISVNYQPAQISPLNITITYPANNASINRPTTMVRGTFSSDAKEISLKVNGIAADIYGNQFVINNVPLVDGDDVIIANGVDSNGAVGRAEVAVKADTTKPYITLNANITSGIPPLATYFQVSTATPNPIVSYQMDFDGDGIIDYTGDTFDNMTFTYTAEGVYYPTATVTDDQVNTYTDTVAITVLSKEKMDQLLRGKWERMKAKLANRDIEGSLKYFVVRSQENYRRIFEVLKDQLPMIMTTFVGFNTIDVYERIAEYEVVANENGIFYSYPGTFMKDANGIWKFNDF